MRLSYLSESDDDLDAALSGDEPVSDNDEFGEEGEYVDCDSCGERKHHSEAMFCDDCGGEYTCDACKEEYEELNDVELDWTSDGGNARWFIDGCPSCREYRDRV